MSAPDAVDERQRITRSAPTAHRVAVAVIAARVAFDPLGFGGRRAGVWEDALARAPTTRGRGPGAMRRARCARRTRSARSDALAGGGSARTERDGDDAGRCERRWRTRRRARGTEDDGGRARDAR